MKLSVVTQIIEYESHIRIERILTHHSHREKKMGRPQFCKALDIIGYLYISIMLKLNLKSILVLLNFQC